MENSREFYAAAAQQRWLLPEEVFDVLCRHEPLGLFVSGAPPRLPPTGALFLFDRRTCKRFRKDGHNWLTRKSGARITRSARSRSRGTRPATGREDIKSSTRLQYE